ncbi:MAG: DNA/RNA nuclease SfsA [Clostridia bacterium]|nr:DNA/RNA nuclease SfsA [Clostridia bacterium]
MKYERIYEGRFISRPNRFIANIEIDGKEQVCHVKNTGRCRELFIPDAKVFVQKADNPERKTAYDLISVYKGDALINVDSQVPNKVFAEWVMTSKYFGENVFIKPECKYKNSRFDFYIEAGQRKIFVEVKGVTLENDGVVSFPDAPTERGVKHLCELMDACDEGYEAYVFFIIQMKECKYFTPNREKHPEFADAVKKAADRGVIIKALNCNVTRDSICADKFTDIYI